MVLNVISAYNPQVGIDKSAKRQFWEDLDGLIRAIPGSEKLFIGGDLNGYYKRRFRGSSWRFWVW